MSLFGKKQKKPVSGGADGQERPEDAMRRKVTRLSAVTAVAAFVAVGSALAGASALTTASQVQAQAQEGMVTAVVASKDIQAGAVLKEGMLETKTVSSACLPSNAVTEEEAAELIGSTAVVKVSAGSAITPSSFTGDTNDSSLANKLEKGTVATTISVSAETDFNQSLLQIGDKVTLYYFMPYNDSTKETWDGDEKKFKKADKADGIADGLVRMKLAENLSVAALADALNENDMVSSSSSSTASEDSTGTGATERKSYSTVSVSSDEKTAQMIREVQENGWTVWLTLSPTVDATAKSTK